MLTNRSAPHARVVPILMVANVRPAVTWCARVFGFVEHVQTAQGRNVQLGLPGGGELLLGEMRPRPAAPSDDRSAPILIRVDDAAATLARAVDNYATVFGELQESEAGERQAMIDDVFGHPWVITQPARLSTDGAEPRANVVPVVHVANARTAVDWYTRVFGFVGHVHTPEGAHAELALPGGGELIVGEVRPLPRSPRDARSPEILLKVEDAAATLARAVENGASVVAGLQDIEAGERQATIDDVFGHRWLLTQTLVDTAPEQWGGKTVTPRR
jgi:PhnB protein